MKLKEGEKWFVAQLKPNGAQIAKRNLLRQGFKIFLPMEKVTNRQSGRFTTGLRPLFPGYIFIAFDVTMGLWRKVNSTYGISRLVTFGKLPAEVPADLMAQFIQRSDDEGQFGPTREFASGDKVRVVSGPLVDCVAEIEKAAPDRRIWILMDIMDRSTRIKIEPSQLEPLRSG